MRLKPEHSSWEKLRLENWAPPSLGGVRLGPVRLGPAQLGLDRLKGKALTVGVKGSAMKASKPACSAQVRLEFALSGFARWRLNLPLPERCWLK